jgi:hypothetical protein
MTAARATFHNRFSGGFALPIDGRTLALGRVPG